MTTERPPEIAHFVDREDEAAQVFAGLEEWTAPNRAFPVVLWGPAGPGRTELAHRIARTWYARTGGRVLTADLDRFRLRGRASTPGTYSAICSTRWRWRRSPPGSTTGAGSSGGRPGTNP